MASIPRVHIAMASHCAEYSTFYSRVIAWHATGSLSVGAVSALRRNHSSI